MFDFAAARRIMVDSQIRTADVTDKRLLAAVLDLPRERFLPRRSAELAYLDLDVPVNEPGRPVRKVLKPAVLAKLLQTAAIIEQDRVLDVGCTTGYSSALLAALAGSVVALEEDAELARQAQQNCADNTRITVVNGPLVRGWPAGAPYDAIVIEGATELVPQELLSQLKDGGRLVCVLGRGASGKAMLYRKLDGEVSGRPVFDAAAPLLPGFTRPEAFVF